MSSWLTATSIKQTCLNLFYLFPDKSLGGWGGWLWGEPQERSSVREHVNRAFQPQAYVSNPGALIHQQRLFRNHSLPVESQPVEHLPAQRAYKDAVLPFGEQISRIECQPGGRDDGVPIIDGLLRTLGFRNSGANRFARV